MTNITSYRQNRLLKLDHSILNHPTNAIMTKMGNFGAMRIYPKIYDGSRNKNPFLVPKVREHTVPHLSYKLAIGLKNTEKSTKNSNSRLYSAKRSIS